MDSITNRWLIWICRCPGVCWQSKPRHQTCADCQQLIREVEVKRA